MALLTSDGATVRSEGGALTVIGVDAAHIGDLAARHGIALHELSPQRASLEEAFFELTDESVEYHGADLTKSGATTENRR
jgi:ABC-2 type transport system ATP-binding protein